MSMPFPLFLLARIGSAVALLAVATYYLLASIPFAYYHFLQFPHFVWMPVFIRLNALIMLAGVVGSSLTVRDLPVPMKPAVRVLVSTGALTVMWMAAMTCWPVLQSYENAALMAFVPIVLLGAAGGIDFAALCQQRARVRRLSAPVADLITPAAIAGGLVGCLYLLRGLIAASGSQSLDRSQLVVAGVITLTAHQVLFLTPALLMAGLQAIATRRSWSPWWESLSLDGSVAIFLAWFIKRCLLTALILEDRRAAALSVLLAVALVIYWRSLLWRSVRTGHHGAFQQSLLPIASTGRSRTVVVIMCVLLLAVGVGIVPDVLRLADWGLTLQKLVVLATWIGSFALVVALPQSWRRLTAGAAALTIVVALTLGASVLRAYDDTRPADHAGSTIDIELAVEQYATFDTSLLVILDLVRPVLSDRSFFETLRTVGDATADPSLRPVPLRLVQNNRTTSSYRPHIFVIVVDSLRPDYLSPYNEDVWFTPSIQAFAGDSIVFRHAFTQYAGTGLSQPALWAGGLIQRAMYIKPFSAVDNLDRLLQMGGYRRYMSIDQILSIILEDDANLTRLDTHLTHPDREEQAYKFDICATVNELTGRLDGDRNDRRPIFFYSQPQNLHIRLIPHSKYSSSELVRRGSSQFFRPTVTTLGEVDRCFGNLIAYLKRTRMYDDSIIVLTSDHGDAYGEGGQWGHAFYLGPETLRVPLIMHVPERLREGRTWDSENTALLSDVTPTLYDLLGYTPQVTNDLLGQPLLRRVDDQGHAGRDNYLVQSSYGRVFGLLNPHGEWLYVADANHLSEQFFDLRSGKRRGTALTPAERIKYRKWLLADISRLNSYYTSGSRE
ncbi:MAG: hypothetical protein C5B57_11095 [Blastocatellia bacterium]|nr:MAG: hypothetical protein C5B57_11095 [Blastocatellia bacterium]